MALSLCVMSSFANNTALAIALAQGGPSDLPSRFKTPPSSLYAFWFWMGANISKKVITKDLEAMHKAGFEGAIIMHVYGFVDGKPLWPERTFRSPYWWEAVKHAAAEADRLGMKITLTNGAGWAGTNGTWIDQKHATQPCAVPLGMGLEESANPFDIRSVEFPPLHDHDACHGCKIEPFSKC